MFVVLEYHPTDMKDFMRQKRRGMDTTQILKICSQISCALNFLFDHRIVHRDVKLDNFLMSSDNSPILCDFGLAVKIDESCFGRVDVPGGNQNHTAPEVLNEFFRCSHTSVDSYYVVNYAKQPSWELGVICYEIAVGEHPFGDYPMGGELPNLHVTKPDVSQLEKLNFPQLFIDTIVGLVENDPEKRISISTACAQFEGCL